MLDVTRPILLALLLSMLPVSAATARGGLWYVDDDNCPGPGTGSIADPFCSIQDAIDAASNGDVVEIAAGVYVQTIDFAGKPITVRSADPTDPAVVAATILDGGGAGTPVVVAQGEGPATVLAGVTIRNGAGGAGGGMRVTGASPIITDCVFSANHVGSRGAGLWLNNSGAIVRRCAFLDNIADDSGGGLYVLGGAAVIDACRFHANTAVEEGGAVRVGGSGTTAIMSNCLFEGNVCDDIGGAVYVYFTSGAVIANCTFVDNEALGGGGESIRVDGTAAVANCIVRHDDEAPLTGGGTIDATWSNIGCDAGSCAVAGTGNIDLPPDFVDAGAGDYRLAPFSPGIDAGDVSSIPLSGADGDLAGADRVFDDPGQADTGAGGVDMGAYERQESSCAGDTDDSGVTDVVDLVNVILDWGTDGSVHGGDVDGSGVVDVADLVLVVLFFGACGAA